MEIEYYFLLLYSNMTIIQLLLSDEYKIFEDIFFPLFKFGDLIGDLNPFKSPHPLKKNRVPTEKIRYLNLFFSK